MTRSSVSSEMSAKMEGFDWTSTALGPLSRWQEPLLTLADLVSKSRIHSCLFWGDDAVMIPSEAWERDTGRFSESILGLSAGEISTELKRAYEIKLKSASSGDIIDIGNELMPLAWRILVDRPFAELNCTPIFEQNGRCEGLLVQLALKSDFGASSDGTNDLKARNAFMLHLSDALRRLHTVDSTQMLGTTMLGQELHASKCICTEIDVSEGVANNLFEFDQAGAVVEANSSYQIKETDFAFNMLKKRMPVIVNDFKSGSSRDHDATETFNMTGMNKGAQLTVPIQRADVLVATFTLCHDQPHKWTVNEIAAAYDAGTRIWEAVERARAEAAAAESARRFRALVTATSCIVFRMTPDWNEMVELHGNSIVPAMTEPNKNWLTKFVASSDQSKVLAAIPDAIRTKSVFELEHQIKRTSKTPHWVLSRAVPLMDSEGEITEWFGAASDITQRRLAEDMVQRETLRLLAETQTADGRKAQLMAVLAHDLRTPILVILEAMDLFKMGADKGMQTHVLSRIERDGHHILEMIDDVLELARLGAGEVIAKPEPFSVKSLLEGVSDLIQTQAGRKGTTVNVVAPDMLSLVGDTTSLRRVLLNFATNAVKATQGGTIELSATIDETSANGEVVVFSVVDTGLGIAPRDIEKLFTDFGMLESSGVAWEGTGLGLAICRRLAEAMGGEVGVESDLGKGARFWIKLVLPNAAGFVAAISERPSVTADPATVLAGLRVLVAEDHEIIRLLTRTNLTRLGASVVEATDGVEAVEIAAREAFDLILLDISMPRLDGDQAALQIRSGAGPSAQAQLIGITAHQTPLDSARMNNSALNACITKPLNFVQLANLLHGITKRKDPEERSISDELFDAETIKYLRSIDDGVLLSRALKDLAREIADAEGILDELITEGKTIDAGKFAHKLAGICEVLGAQKMAAHLRSFEDLASISEADDLRQAFTMIRPVFRSMLIALTEAISENQERKEGSKPPKV